MAKNEGEGGFWTGLLLGGILGAGLALLFAPRAGQETREQILERSTEMTGRARSTVEDVSTRARETATGIAARSRAFVDEGKATLSEAVAEGREEAARVAQELQVRFEETRAKATES